MGRRKQVTQNEVVALHELCGEVLEHIDDYGSTPAECFARRYFQKKIKAFMQQFALKNGSTVRKLVDEDEITGEFFEEGYDGE